MWILAQHKNFIKQAEEVWIEPSDTSNNASWSVIANDYVVLGRYKSEDRAKEIIADMWNCMKNSISMYEMPEA